MIYNILLVIFILIVPGISLWLEDKSRFVKWLSPVAICYLAGITIGNLPFYTPDSGLLGTMTEISVGIAIPMMLFNTKVSDWIRYSGKMLFSYFLCCVGAVLGSMLIFEFFKNDFPEAGNAAGMLVGVYVGGTFNMSAVGIALNVPKEIFILLNSADTLIGAVYFAFLITIAQRTLGLFLPKFVVDKKPGDGTVQDFTSNKFSLKILYNAIILIALSVAILGLALYITKFFAGQVVGPYVLVIITSIGIGLSFVKRVRTIKGAYDTGNYFLLIFAVSIGAMANVSQLVTKSPMIFLYTTLVMTVAILIHFILAAIFRIDRDTVIITSTAGIFSVPFIGPVAKAINNEHIIAPGIAMGLLGYAIGNYLGLGVAFLLR
jgi:uncharacterized membrane protein